MYVTLIHVCIACLVLSSGNRKKMLRQAPSRATRTHPPMQGRNLAGRQDISEDPGTSKFEGSDVQTRRISQQDL